MPKGDDGMPLTFIRDDIARLSVDAIVNPSNTKLVPGGGVSAAIFAAAGDLLRAACEAIAACPVGHSVLTPGFGLKAKYVIHCCPPVRRNGSEQENELLRSCYRTALELAQQKNLTSIAFPLLGAGHCGFPPETALQIAVSEISAFLENNEISVTLVLFDSPAMAAAQAHDAEIRQFISDNYAEQSPYLRRSRRFSEYEELLENSCMADEAPVCRPMAAPSAPAKGKRSAPVHPTAADASAPVGGASLDDILSEQGESFSNKLFRLIDDRGWKDSDVYKRANIDRKLFSKIRSNLKYHPKKSTAMALAVALELNPVQADDLLNAAGYAFSSASRGDLIVRWYLDRHIFDINEINLTLFRYEEPLLGI